MALHCKAPSIPVRLAATSDSFPNFAAHLRVHMRMQDRQLAKRVSGIKSKLYPLLFHQSCLCNTFALILTGIGHMDSSENTTLELVGSMPLRIIAGFGLSVTEPSN